MSRKGWYKEFIPFEVNQTTYSQAKNWCHKELGKEGTPSDLRKWSIGYDYANYGRVSGFLFQNEIDAMAFKLRWI